LLALFESRPAVSEAPGARAQCVLIRLFVTIGRALAPQASQYRPRSAGLRLFRSAATNGSCRIHVAEVIVCHEG